MKDVCDAYAVRMVPASGDPIEETGGALAAEETKVISFSDLAADTCYRPEISVSDSVGETEAVLAVVYSGELSVAKSRDADMSAMSPAIFVVSRGSSAAAIGYDLIVNYEITGTAGTYETPSGTVTIPAGESSVEVTVMPVFDGSATTSVDLSLQLSAGNYRIGESASATAQIIPAKLEATARYVGEKGDDANSGLTPGAPKLSVAAAIADLGEDGGTVYVMPGTVVQSSTAVIATPVDVIGLGVTPDEGWRLSGWLVNGVIVDGAVTSFTADEPKSLLPEFLPVDATHPVLYVAEDGSDENDGFDAEFPCATIAAALSTASKYENCRGCVWIAPGTYEAHMLEIKTPLEVRGSTGKPEDVVIHSDKGNAQVFLLKDGQILVSGVTVSGADMRVGEGEPYANAGDGFCILGGMVSNCVVRNCSARQTSTPLPMGGGVYLGTADSFMTHCIVSNCSALADADWCGICGGGVHVVNGAVENSLVVDCRIGKAEPACAKIVGGLYLAGGRAVNCSVLDCTGSQCGGIRVEGAAAATNCVAFACRKTLVVSDVLETTPSPWSGTAAGFVNCATDGDEAINETCKLIAESAFANYDGGDYCPLSGGPLVSAGIAVEGWEKDGPMTDLAGRPRVTGSRIDIGCYELANQPGLTILFR